MAMASSTGLGARSLPFFVRESHGLSLLSVDPSSDEATVVKNEAQLGPLNQTEVKAKVAAWSPDGNSLALADPNQGIVVLELGDGREGCHDSQLQAIANSSKTTQTLFWSPLSSSLVSVSVVPKGSTEHNLQVWRRNKSNEGCESGGGTGEYLNAASFSHPKLERSKKVLQWTEDEAFCARLCPDGTVRLHDGGDLAGTPLLELSFAHPAQNFEFAPGRFRGSLKARLAVFVPDVRDDMQRTAAPGETTIWEVLGNDTGLSLQAQKRVEASVSSGQNSELKWSPTGTALLAHCTTDVDESGKSYFGGSKLLLISHDGTYQKDLTESDETTSTTGTSVQAIQWNPTKDEFILIRGFQPAQATLWSWDAKAQKATIVKVLLEKAHRNTIRFNHFGSLVCLAGFGNLIGEMDFFGRLDDERCDYTRVSSCTANCTVSCDWAPDGRHLLTAVLAPRMRVDNGFSIWRALTGHKVADKRVEELFEAQWRPEPPQSIKFLNITPEEVEQATKGFANRAGTQQDDKKKNVYRPPKARGAEGASTVSAMMRGEAAVPDNEDRRGRRPWMPRARDAEDPTASPGLAPSEPPPAAAPLERADSATSGTAPAALANLGDLPPPPGSPPEEASAEPSQAKAASTVPPPVRSAPPGERPPPPPEPVPKAPWAQQQGLVREPVRTPAPPPISPASAPPPSGPPQAAPQAPPPGTIPMPQQATPVAPPVAPAPRRQQAQQQPGAPQPPPPQQPAAGGPAGYPAQRQQAGPRPGERPSVGPQQPAQGPPPPSRAVPPEAAAATAAAQAAAAAAAQVAAAAQAQQLQSDAFGFAQAQAAAARQAAAAGAAGVLGYGDNLAGPFAPQRQQQQQNQLLQTILAADGANFPSRPPQQPSQVANPMAPDQFDVRYGAAAAARQHLQGQHAEMVRNYREQQQQQQREPQPREQPQQREPQQRQQPPPQQQQPPQQEQDRRPCPPNNWQYVDPKGNVQGPFTLLEMQLWNSMGYFRPDLPMRCDPNDQFVEFSKLFPPGGIPFQSYPRRIANNGSDGRGPLSIGGR